jgi:hypothetical protein
MKEHFLNEQNPFIRGYYIDPQLCDQLVSEIRMSDLEPSNDFRNYSSVWLESFPKDLKIPYINSIIDCIETYKKEFEFCYKDITPWTLKAGVKVQKYNPGNFYSQWHPENGGGFASISRNLVFMTYLNDIQDGGGTEFYYQKMQVKPEKGLTLIWPTDWTHVHRGIVSETEEKFIITGWFVYDLTGKWTGV